MRASWRISGRCTAALEVENNVIGLSTFAAEKMRKTLELETAAKKDAIGLTPARVAEIEKEATAYARATAAMLGGAPGRLRGALQRRRERDRQLTDAWLEGGKNMGETIRQVLADLVKLAVQMSLINPLKNALFGGSAPTFGGIDIFSILFGGGARGGASSVVNLIPGIGGIGKNARGTRNWRGGWTDVGEEGQCVWLPKGSQVYSNSELKGMGGQRPVNNFYGVPSQPEERPNASGGFDYIFKEIDRRFADGRMGNGFANKYALRAPTGRP